MLVPVPAKKPEESPTDTEKIPDRDFDVMCNPAVHALKQALEEFAREPTSDLIEQMHMILLMDGAQYQTKVQNMLKEVFPLLERGEFYEKVCLLLSDVSHCNPRVVDSLLSFDMFSKLDYSKDISFSLVFNMCDGNVEAWRTFRERHLKPGFEENKYVKMLMEGESSALCTETES